MAETKASARARRELKGAGIIKPLAPVPVAMSAREGKTLPIDEIMRKARALARVYSGQCTAEDLEDVPGEWVTHPIWGKLFVGQMQNVGYEELDGIHPNSLNRKAKSDLIYLHRGILLPRFEPEQIKELYAIDAGPATQDVIAAIKRWNPTREEKQDWITSCIGNDTLFLMFNTAMINLGMWPELTNLYDSEPENLSEEHQAKRLVFDRLLRFMPLQNAISGINETAQELDIPLTLAGAKAALEAQQKIKAAGINPAVLPSV
jgi:hypothetical protein